MCRMCSLTTTNANERRPKKWRDIPYSWIGRQHKDVSCPPNDLSVGLIQFLSKSVYLLIDQLSKIYVKRRTRIA